MSKYFVDFMICDFIEFLKTNNNEKSKKRGENDKQDYFFRHSR